MSNISTYFISLTDKISIYLFHSYIFRLCTHDSKRTHVDSSQNTAITADGGKDAVLSQRAYGELVSSVTCEECDACGKPYCHCLLVYVRNR